MLNNNPTCIVRCPVIEIIRTVVNSRYSYAEEIEFQFYKAKRANETRGYKPVFRPWSSYPRTNRNRPLDAEEVDGESLLGEMEWFDGTYS